MGAETQGKTRLIKRYANRKMYDTERSCYITLEEVSAMVRDGEDVRVVDNKTKEDLTEVTLTQALLDNKRKKRGGVTLVELRKMIASGSDSLLRSITEPVSRVQRDAERTVGKWRSEAERTVDRVLHRGEEGDETVDVPPAPPEPVTDAEESSDARVRHLFANLAARLQADAAVRAERRDDRIADLEARIRHIEDLLLQVSGDEGATKSAPKRRSPGSKATAPAASTTSAASPASTASPATTTAAKPETTDAKGRA